MINQQTKTEVIMFLFYIFLIFYIINNTIKNSKRILKILLQLQQLNIINIFFNDEIKNNIISVQQFFPKCLMLARGPPNN